MLEHRAAALGAGAQRPLGREVHQLAGFFRLVVAEVEFELVVLAFLVELDDHLGRERPAGLGAETVERADVPVTQELLDLGDFKGAPGR